MSRSVSAPSSVTKTSPCWNGLIVPGSTFRYGSNFCSWTRSPRAFSRRPSDAATMPFPRADTTPPVTKTYLGARALTGFQASSGSGRHAFPLRLLAGTKQRVQTIEREAREASPEADEPRALDHERRLGAALVECTQRQVSVDPVAREPERDALLRDHVEHEQHAGRLRPPEVGRPVRADDLPARARSEAAPTGLDAGDSRPPVGEVVRLDEERPDVVERREEDAVSHVPWQGTPGRPASARARPSGPPRRAPRYACASGRPAPSRRGSAARRARRSAAGA